MMVRFYMVYDKWLMSTFIYFISISESRKMQRLAQNHVRRILEEQEKLNYELESKRKELDSWSKELNKREALTERERQKLDEEKRKVILHFFTIQIIVLLLVHRHTLIQVYTTFFTPFTLNEVYNCFMETIL